MLIAVGPGLVDARSVKSGHRDDLRRDLIIKVYLSIGKRDVAEEFEQASVVEPRHPSSVTSSTAPLFFHGERR